jgi:hypothetical protein
MQVNHDPASEASDGCTITFGDHLQANLIGA